MWYDVSKLPYAGTVRSLLLSEKLCNISSQKTGIAGKILIFLTSRRDEIATIGWVIALTFRDIMRGVLVLILDEVLLGG
jgi:hypothetical protein